VHTAKVQSYKNMTDYIAYTAHENQQQNNPQPSPKKTTFEIKEEILQSNKE
jgi:hypothetical protein